VGGGGGGGLVFCLGYGGGGGGRGWGCVWGCAGGVLFVFSLPQALSGKAEEKEQHWEELSMSGGGRIKVRNGGQWGSLAKKTWAPSRGRTDRAEE